MRYASAPQRREELLRRLTAAGYVSSAELADAMGVSDMTIRRDLRLLEEQGRVRRVMGGASLPAPAHRGAPFEDRRARSTQAKRAIAAAALPLLAGVDSVALDAGTTVAGVAPSLPAGLTVVSHSLPVLDACAARTDLEVIGLGGTYVPGTRSFAGPLTRAAAEDLAVDVVLLSAAGYGPDGLYSANALDAEVKRALLRAAARVVLLVDATKAGVRAPVRFAPMGAVDVVLTDHPPEWLDGSVGEIIGVAVDEVEVG
ncbi:DeoR/GlpR family DNA-binding transcription regulator [Georgenia faecalis]|uniref:DeoR/GlpR family DNA-binding transcription regulator n=1 Tax=Georgenia faecalis TaxID=2483799 RepID=UPI0013DFF344|nr:DeoR/GlpR family DNA-binding transcription regulator [Georgenia faecalis]